jgi:hypothetical protein
MYNTIYKHLMNEIKGVAVPENEIEIINVRPVTQTSYFVDHKCVASHMAIGSLLNDIHEIKGEKRQKFTIDFVHSSLSLISFFMNTINDNPILFPDRHRIWPYYPVMNAYKTKDGRQVYIAGVYPNMRDAYLDLFHSPNNFESLTTAILKWDSLELEEEINKRGLAGCLIRTSEEWLKHPQGRTLSQTPIIDIKNTGHTSPVPFPKGDIPLSGLKVIDFTHLLAGPTCTRTLAEQGADVLHISGPKIEEYFPFVVDTGLGKRNTYLNLGIENSRQALINLIKTADVFVESYTPGKLSKLGFGPEEVRLINPHIIYVSISCFGSRGPWSSYKGFEQIAQAVSGLMVGHSSLENPQLFPAAPCDYMTGHLATIGILEALKRRSQQGGSYRVEVSLVRTAMFIDSFGHREGKDSSGAFPEDFAPYLHVSPSPYGRIKHLKPILQNHVHPDLSLTPLGSSLPIWL